jgi:RNA polymerase sigma-70 factor (ECF subfamily)
VTTGDGPAAAAIDTVEADGRDVAAARNGDHDAFGRLYDRHAAVVLSLCRRLALSEAEDATQETFIRAHRKLDRLQSAEKLRPWLYAIARRVCSERNRARRRRARHEEAFAVNRAAAPLPGATADGAPENAARAEDLTRLDAALDRLDDRERLAIHLYYLEADPVKAAMSALGLSRSGYYKLLARARENLAGLMGPQGSKP